MEKETDMKSKLQTSMQRSATKASKSSSPQAAFKAPALSSLAAKRLKPESKGPIQAPARKRFDEAQFVADMRVLQQAHQIVMRRNEEVQQQKENPDRDFQAQETYSNFVNYTSVRELLDEVSAPLQEAIPQLREELGAHQTGFLALQGQVSSNQSAIQELQEQMKEIGIVKANHGRLCKTVELEAQRVVDNFEKTEQEFTKLRNQLKMFHELIAKQSQKHDRQDEKVRQSHLSIERFRIMFQERFDEWFANAGAEQKRLWRGLRDLEQAQKKTEESVKEFQEQAKTSLDATIKSVAAKSLVNQKSLDKFDMRLKHLDKQLAPLSKLAGTVEDLVSQKPVLQQHTTFLTETLPLLMHLTVCEAVDKVVGRENRRAVVDFERKKLVELREWTARRTGQRGLQALTKRVAAFSFVYARQDQGVLPFAYGMDSHALANGDEEVHVDMAHITELSKRYEKLLEEEEAFREAVELACGDPRKVSPALLKHKLTKLTEGQVVRLRNAIANRRVLELDKYDDFLLEVPKLAQQKALAGAQQALAEQARKMVQKEPTGFGSPLDSSRVGGLSTGSVEGAGHAAARQAAKMPDKIFVMKAERLRPYQRLERKYGQLFGTAVAQFVEFKAKQLENFAKAAQMTLQLTAEINLVKEVVQELQAGLEESDGRLRAGLQEQDERLREAVKAAEARAKHVAHGSMKHVEKEMRRLDNETNQQEQKLDDVVRTTRGQYLEQCAVNEQLEQRVLELSDSLAALRTDAERGQQSVLDQVGDIIATHVDENLAAQVEQMVESKAVRLVGERFMEIQRRVDLNTEQMQTVMKDQQEKNEEVIEGLKRQTEAKQEQDKGVAMKLIKAQATVALQGQSLKTQTTLVQEREAQLDEVASAAASKAAKPGIVTRARVEAASPQGKADAPGGGDPSARTPSRKGALQSVSPEKPLVTRMATRRPAGKTLSPNALKENVESPLAHKSQAEQAKEAEEKQRQKQEKLKKLEEKRKKDRLIAQRQKEREERQAEIQRQREEEEAEQAKAEEFTAQKKQQEEEIKAKYAQRIAEMHRMMQKSKTTKMGEQFLVELGAQKGGQEAADAKLANRQARASKGRAHAPASTFKSVERAESAEQAGQAGVGRQLTSKSKPKTDLEASHQSKEGPVSVIASNDNKTTSEAQTSEEDAGSDDFVNPFDFMKKGKAKEAALSPEKFEEMLQPKVAAMQATLKAELEQVYGKIDAVSKSQSDSLSSTKDQVLQEVAELAKNLETLNKELQHQQRINEQYQQRLTYDMEDTKQRMDLETQEIQKLRKGVKKDIAAEMAKITSDDASTKYELRRINAVIANIRELTSLLVEDQMLSQLLQEQEALDKKQIALFGLKKNSQILGTNQYAMQNNLVNACQSGEGRAPDGIDEQQEGKAFWDLRNKRKKYNDVVKGPVLAGKNIRGADVKQLQKSATYLAGARSRSPQALSLGADPRATNENVSPRSAENDKDGDQLLNEPFMARYDQAAQYNTIYLDRSCGSCQPGSSAKTLSLLKVACLSYVSSPIRYGPIPPRPLGLGAPADRGAATNSTSGLDVLGQLENTLSRVRAAASPAAAADDDQSIVRVGPHCFIDLQVCEVLQLKEGLLRSCQRVIGEGFGIDQSFPACFGDLGGRNAVVAHLPLGGSAEASPQVLLASPAGEGTRTDPVGSLRPEVIGYKSASHVGGQGGRRRALRADPAEVAAHGQRRDSTEDAEGAWPRDDEELKGSTLRPVGALHPVGETRCLDSPPEGTPRARNADFSEKPGLTYGRSSLPLGADPPSAWTKRASATSTAMAAPHVQDPPFSFSREGGRHSPPSSPKFEIRVLQDLIRWRQQAKQQKSVQLFISEMARKQRALQLQQTQQHRRLERKHSELRRRNEVEERLRTISVFSSEHERMAARAAGQGGPARYRASRSKSKDASRFRPAAADTEGPDETTKTDLLVDQSFSQANLNTLISSSQLIKAGQLKSALNSSVQHNKIMRSSLNVASNARATAGATFSQQYKDNRSAGSKAQAVRPRTHQRNPLGISANFEPIIHDPRHISRTLNTTLLSDKVPRTKDSSHTPGRPTSKHFPMTPPGVAEHHLRLRQSKAKSTMAVKPMHQHLSGPQGASQKAGLPSDGMGKYFH